MKKNLKGNQNRKGRYYRCIYENDIINGEIVYCSECGCKLEECICKLEEDNLCATNFNSIVKNGVYYI